MTRNQFLTDANAYLEAISPNYAKSTMDEKSRKLRYYARVFYTLHLDGRIRTKIIGMFLRWKGNDAKEIYDVQYGNRKPHAYNGKLDPLSDDVIERVYALARETDSWQVLEGCVAIILGCAAGLRPQESRQLYASDVHWATSPRYSSSTSRGRGRGAAGAPSPSWTASRTSWRGI